MPAGDHRRLDGGMSRVFHLPTMFSGARTLCGRPIRYSRQHGTKVISWDAYQARAGRPLPAPLCRDCLSARKGGAQ